MKIAFVYDRVNKIGGAERVLLALHEIWPKAPLFTTVYDKKGAPWANVFDVRPSFMQNIPFAKKHHELFPWLAPLAFESFNFDEYDLVISITSAEAKGIITKPETLHICYCLTPTRYLWSDNQNYIDSIHMGPLTLIAKSIVEKIFLKLKSWDKIASNRPDYYIAISNNVASRIERYYQKDSLVIYPPVDTEKFQPSKIKNVHKNYFLVVSRLVPYKRIDIAIKAFNQLGLSLKIIGRGVEEKRLKNIANNNIEFISNNLTDEELIRYYQECQALIFPGVEDFGLVPIEAQACGKPVMAFKKGGVLESIVEGKTGEFFYPQDEQALLKAVKLFKTEKYDQLACRKQAEKFNKQFFKINMKNTIENLYNKYMQEKK